MGDVSGTTLARVARILIEEAERLGADRPSLLRESGLTESAFADPDRRIPASWTTDLWMAIVRALPDGDTGVRMGASRALKDYGLVGYTMLHSPTLGDAFEHLQRYSRIVHDFIGLTIDSDADFLRLTFLRRPILDVLRQPAEYVASRMVASARELTTAEILPAEVLLPHPAGAWTAVQRDMFGSRVVHDADDLTIVFHASDARRPIVQADHELGDYLDALADRTLQELPERTSFVASVRRAIWDHTHGTAASLDEVAESLGASARSVQRRLTLDGTSFQVVRDEVRRTMATRLLQGADLAIQEISYLLGYSDSSAFHRAFRRWEGLGPRQFREAVRAAADGRDR
jgi:AraC-like DNA-binding protein